MSLTPWRKTFKVVYERVETRSRQTVFFAVRSREGLFCEANGRAAPHEVRVAERGSGATARPGQPRELDRLGRDGIGEDGTEFVGRDSLGRDSLGRDSSGRDSSDVDSSAGLQWLAPTVSPSPVGLCDEI
jgi:hypothetical protein